MTYNFRQFSAKKKNWTIFWQSDLKLDTVGVINKRIDNLNPTKSI